VTAEAAVASILGEAPVAAKPCERRSTNQRRGSTTLFAALNVLDGSVVGRNIARHGHQEFTRFLKAVDLRHEPPARERQGFEVWPSSLASFANANDGQSGAVPSAF
jgi:hypothetical protein